MTPPEHTASVQAVVRSWRRAPLAAIAWSTSDGIPDAATVLPLTEGDRPVLALPYAQLELARALEASTETVLAVRTPPDAPSDTPPDGGSDTTAGGADPTLVVRGRAQVTADPRGERFHDSGLIELELAKYPTSRRRLDSLLLRREHWWFLPRLLVTIDGLHGPSTLPPHDALLVTGGQALTVEGCHLDARDPLRMRATGRGPLRRPAMVLEYGGDVPELEQLWERRWQGTLEGDRFETAQVTGEGPPARALTLRQRMRAERQLERACRSGLRAAGLA